MRVRSIMREARVRVRPETSCSAVLAQLQAAAAHCALVESEAGVLGLVDIDEVESLALARDSEVGSIARESPVTLDPNDSIARARSTMKEHKQRHLPVRGDGETLATISWADISALLEHLIDRRLLRGLTHDDVAELLEVTVHRDVAAGNVIHVEGESPIELFIVTSGLLSVHTQQAGRIAWIHPGEMVGAMELFGDVNAATVKAEEPCQLLVIERERLVSFLAERPKMAATIYSNIALLLSNRLRKANRFMFLRGIAQHRMLVFKVLAIIGLAFVLFTVGFGVASESPEFCTSCHYMKPYYDTWTVSAHNDVRCVECHYSYGMNGVIRGKITGLAMVTRYLTRTYDPKPEAEVSDNSCTRSGCHATFLPTQTAKKWPNVRFTHAAHADSSSFGAQLRCTSCHEHGRGSDHFSVAASTCYLCHLKNQPSTQLEQTCRTCHFFRSDPERVTQIDHATLPERMSCLDCHGALLTGQGQSEESRCYSCHLEPRTLSTPALHRAHLERREVACSECHSEILHEMGTGLSLSRNCDNCHKDQHRTQEQIYLGQGGREVVRTPGIMSYFHVECTGCHRNDSTSTAPTLPGDEVHREDGENDNVCVNCHSVEYQDKLRMWQSTINDALVSARASLENVTDVLQSRSTDIPSQALHLAKELVQDAQHNIRLVEEDRSRGVHNFKYTRDLLNVAQQKLERAMELLQG